MAVVLTMFPNNLFFVVVMAFDTSFLMNLEENVTDGLLL